MEIGKYSGETDRGTNEEIKKKIENFLKNSKNKSGENIEYIKISESNRNPKIQMYYSQNETKSVALTFGSFQFVSI